MDKYTRFLIDSGAMAPSDIGTSHDIARTIRAARSRPTTTEREITERTGFSVAEQQDVNSEMLEWVAESIMTTSVVRFRPLPGGGVK